MPIARHFSSKPGSRLRWALTCAVLALTACGGGGSSSSSGGSGETPTTFGNVVGAWRDITTTERPPLAALILPNGAYWAFYDGTGGTAGFAQGNASATGTNFQASTTEYLNGFEARAVNVSAQMAIDRLSGERSWNTAGNMVRQSFVLTPMPSSNYLAAQAQISDLQGSWTGTLSGSSATLLVPMNSGGVFSGSGGSSGCNFEGTLTSQNNAYAFDVSLNFTGSCSQAGTITTGIAMVYKINGSAQKQLLLAVQNSDRSKGWLFSAIH